MANAVKDGNRVPTMLGALNTDGLTPINVKVDPASHVVQVLDDTTGTDHSGTNDIRDANRVTALMGVSSADGITPCVIYVDSSGNLLINSN